MPASLAPAPADAKRAALRRYAAWTLAGLVASAAVIAAIACAGSLAKKEARIESCNTSLDPTRRSVAYVDDRGLALRRPDREVRVPFGDCVPSAKDVAGTVALADGWRALVYQFRSKGGNWIESGSVTDRRYCIVDFSEGGQKQIDQSLFGDPRHFRLHVGRETGWLYSTEVGRPLAVIDVDKGIRAELPIRADDDRAAIVEVGGTVVVVTAELHQTDPNQPIYRGEILVRRFSAKAWPPAPVADSSEKRIDVEGRSDRITISDDGRWLAYHGSPYRAGAATDLSDLGLVDLEQSKVLFETLAPAGRHRVGAIVISDADPYLLVTSEDPPDKERVGRVGWLSRDGKAVGKKIETKPHATASWWSEKGRVVVDEGCELQLVDLPPPPKAK